MKALQMNERILRCTHLVLILDHFLNVLSHVTKIGVQNIRFISSKATLTVRYFAPNDEWGCGDDFRIVYLLLLLRSNTWMYSSTMSYKWHFRGYMMIFKKRSRNYFAQQGKCTYLWNLMMYTVLGRISCQWGIGKLSYCRSRRLYDDKAWAEQWTKYLVSTLWQYGVNCWRVRKQHLYPTRVFSFLPKTNSYCPEDQSYDSFDEAMVLWLDDHLPNEGFQHQQQWMLR